MSSVNYQAVETPFECRHCCWFCGEPSSVEFSFPQAGNYNLDHPHPALSLPCCNECLTPANKSKTRSIWSVSIDVKKFLLKKYRKDLAIGVNWTQEELENSGFEDGNFAGFQKSAWKMFEIARERVNYMGWPLVVSGISIDNLRWQEPEGITFDGVHYPTVDEAVLHYANIFDLQREFFREVLHKLGHEKFSQAVRFCRLLVGSTPNERRTALNSL